MKALITPILASVWAIMMCATAVAQTAVVVQEGLVGGRVVVVNPMTNVMTIRVQPGDSPMNLYGLERARIERAAGQLGNVTQLRPGTTVAVYYAARDGHWYPSRIVIPDPNLAVPVAPLTAAEERALESKAANDGDITTNPGVKARIDRDITTQPGRKDPADPDITKQGR